MLLLSSTRAVWRNAYISEVLLRGLPFPHSRLADMGSTELERSVKRALRIGSFWRSDRTNPAMAVDFTASSGTGVSDVRFLPGYDGRRLATLSKGIWSVISCWEIPLHQSGEAPNANAHKVAEWCPKGTIITGLVVNSDAHSNAVIATSVNGRCVHELICSSIAVPITFSQGDNVLRYYLLWNPRMAPPISTPSVRSTLQ